MSLTTSAEAETQAANDLRTVDITLNFAEGEIMKTINIVDPETTVEDIVRMIRADVNDSDADNISDIFASGLLCADTPKGKIQIRRGRKRVVIAEFHHSDGFLPATDVTIYGPDGNEIP